MEYINMFNIEKYKSSTEFKALDDERGIVVGYPATYDRDSVKDMIIPGSFVDLDNEVKSIPVLYMHDPKMSIGLPITMVEDSRGLKSEWQVNLKSFWGNEAYQGAKFGTVNEL